jgi:4,5-dihydroxyphthalate decarboxylase
VAPLPITLACGPYDRTEALADGRVTVAGTELRYVTLDPEEIFFRMVTYREFDVAELSLSTYLLTHLADGPFVAIPVFPSRMFRHTSVYINGDSFDPARPAVEQLAGKTVGVAEYQLTANVWIRGILAEHYGVPVASMRYRTGGLDTAGRHEKVALKLPPEIDVSPIPDGLTLSKLLAAGDLDAVYSPRAPECFGAGSVRRLFDDTRAEEERYFERSRVFPIMHVVVIRRDVYERNRWLAQELLKTFTAAKEIAYQRLARTVALSLTLPFVREEYERTVATMGADYWAYGIGPNHDVLATFCRYAAEQGLADRQPDVETLFAPETTDHFVI